MLSNAKLICAVGLAVLLSCWTAEAGAGEGYYMIVLANDANPRLPRGSHTFATFIKATWDDEDANAKPEAEVHTISWLPANGEIVVVRARPEPGKNITLAETFAWAKERNLRTFALGPFQIKRELYDLALKQKALLESGQVAYKAIDKKVLRGGGRTATNCTHAVSDIDGRQLDVGGAYGLPASQMVVDHLQRWLIDPKRQHDWLWDLLDVDRSAITMVAPTR